MIIPKIYYIPFISGKLKNITKLKPWPLCNVLLDKYEWDPQVAKVCHVLMLNR